MALVSLNVLSVPVAFVLLLGGQKIACNNKNKNTLGTINTVPSLFVICQPLDLF